MKKRIIFHIDVNSAYLSWEATWRLQHGSSLDLRNIPSVVGGDPKSRHGIILAKSIPAKKYEIKTGETLYSARQKCPDLLIVPPNYELYMKCSNVMYSILKEYSHLVQRYSIDECFVDYTQSEDLFGDPLKVAYNISNRIKKELGFTVNIGIANNKLLAKMASELEKPDKIHTLFPNEIEDKMWKLPIDELFMVGRRTLPKLKNIGINTIGDLAKADGFHMKSYLKSHGFLIWNYANGLDETLVREEDIVQKGIGNSTTMHYDVSDRREANLVLLSLAEMVCMRLRNKNALAKLISISIKNSDFLHYSHQCKIQSPTDSTNVIYKHVKKLFDEVWKLEPIRHLGVRVGELCGKEFYQTSFFDEDLLDQYRKIDKTVDSIRKRYGRESIIRGAFLNSGLKPIVGGVGEEEYQMMSSLL
ncbi:DNA polymerase IV [Alkalibaculum sp. M08DMB]|uniref:DNA polymerase IV n=1 Tax=Alkalibaculum sporogenes TaxID=2655001 RepID=A0A6A7K6Z1_9FIRM|nr:DNA polymerase IV [Alkalibaculum sporogenes]MPW25155.1 DNA polymerase IV [Alkalibaculum sporogenes]